MEHFVILSQYDVSGTPERPVVRIADSLCPNPLAHGAIDGVEEQRLIAAVLLGVLTYDGNLLLIRPRESAG